MSRNSPEEGVVFELTEEQKSTIAELTGRSACKIHVKRSECHHGFTLTPIMESEEAEEFEGGGGSSGGGGASGHW
jgi:uncharacterized membrane protein YgcG